MRFNYWQHVLIGCFGATLIIWEACSQTGQSRQSSVGSMAAAPLGSCTTVAPSPTPVASGTTTTDSGTGTDTGTTTGTGSGTSGDATGVTGGTVTVGAATTPTTAAPTTGAMSLAQCQAQNEAWIPVVNNGASPASCGGTLVTWCCTRAEVDARFPSMSAQLEVQFAQFIDTNNEVLYACSTSNGSTVMSLASIVNGTTTYNTVTVSGVLPITPTPDPSPPPCTVVTMANLTSTSPTTLLLNDERREDEGEDEDASGR